MQESGTNQIQHNNVSIKDAIGVIETLHEYVLLGMRNLRIICTENGKFKPDLLDKNQFASCSLKIFTKNSNIFCNLSSFFFIKVFFNLSNSCSLCFSKSFDLTL